MSAVDQGLAAAVQRVERGLAEHEHRFEDDGVVCRCGGVFTNYGKYQAHVAAEVARAAREDVPGLTQQARADELEKALAERVERHPGVATYLFDALTRTWLRERAVAIREGRES